MINIRMVVQTHLLRERVDVLLAVLAPFVLMAESGYANGWMYANGHLGLDLASLMALTRGFCLEVFIYACFKMVRVFLLAQNKRLRLVALIPFLVGLVGMIVSAGCNLGWMMQSPEMTRALAVVVTYLPDWMSSLFREGLGLLFPVGVGVFALFDVSHLVNDLMKSAHLDNKAVMVLRSEAHRTSYLKSLKKSVKNVAEHYDALCDADAQNMVDKVKGGDLSFGAEELAGPAPSAQSAVTRISGPAAFPALSGPAFPPPPPSSPSRIGQPQPALTGQFSTAQFPSTGDTQPLNIPAPAPVQKQGGGLLNNLTGWLSGN